MLVTKRKRTRTGCLTCRARKIKCDETADVCGNCSRSSLECLQSGPGNESLPKAARSQLAISAAEDSDQQLTQAGTRRRRIKRSCISCKVSKKRCNGERPQCDRCLEKRRTCAYDSEDLQQSSPWPQPAQAGSSPPTFLPLAGNISNLDLPDKALTQHLCNSFFEEIAPLRCLGFLHRHTFMQHTEESPLQDNPNPDPLLLSVCALATKTIFNRDLWDRGCGWARLAQSLVLAEIHDISVSRLMAIVLLYEHAARNSEYRLCFTLSGLASRFTQALSLNLEYDHDVMSTTCALSPVERESRRRLMWACYIMDTMMACGLNHLQAIDTTTIQIQLPCNDKYFIYKMARPTATVPLCFDAAANRETRISTENQDMDAFLLRLLLIRERILRYVNDHTDEEDPWRLTSSLADLNHWKESLPPELQFNLDVIVNRREQSMLSALVALHVQYHQINCLLYRCTIPSMLFPARRQTGLSRKASVDFLSNSRRGWFDHACAMSTIFEVALEHRPASMEDPNVGLSAYNAIIIKFLYLTNFVPVQERLPLMQTILPLVNFDLRFLKELHGYHPCVRLPHLSAEFLVEEAKMRITQDPSITLSESATPVGVLRFPTDNISLDHRTNPLAAIAQMRRDLPDVHAPDRATVPLSRDGQKPGEPERLWVWI